MVCALILITTGLAFWLMYEIARVKDLEYAITVAHGVSTTLAKECRDLREECHRLESMHYY